MAQNQKSKPAPKAPKSAPARKPATPPGKPVPTAKAPAPSPAKHPPAKKAAPSPVKPPIPAKAPPPPVKAPAPAKPIVAKKAEKPAKTGKKSGSKAEALRAHILERRTSKPITFTLDEVREIAKTNVGRGDEKTGPDGRPAGGKPALNPDELESRLKKAAQPHHVKAASLADILGYNPSRQAAPTTLDPEQIDPKFQRFYRLLVDLRDHVLNGLNTHTEETLKRSAKEDSGDLSSYSQHMADAGTDTFDRDFALSLVSNEQEALAEIEAAIKRIQGGTYGICELTGKPINKDRLLAVPFARYSVESQTEVERTKRRSANRAGLFGEGEEAGKLEDEGGGEE